jgi:hypothetical protein
MYGQHTCMVCNEAHSLCRDCAEDSYHYCAEDGCQACVCVECDGGRSVKGIYSSGNELLLERLMGRGTTHFAAVHCLLEDPEYEAPCRMPTEYKIVCKDKKTCGGCGPNGCQTCRSWQCPWCEEQCFSSRCDVCYGARCTECHCVRVRECEDRCEPWKSLYGKEYVLGHCSDCYLKLHPLSAGTK